MANQAITILKPDKNPSALSPRRIQSTLIPCDISGSGTHLQRHPSSCQLSRFYPDAPDALTATDRAVIDGTQTFRPLSVFSTATGKP